MVITDLVKMQGRQLYDVIEDELTEVRVNITKDISRLIIAGKLYENVRSGETLSIPYWVASRLVERGVAEYADKILDPATIAQIAWRERRSIAELIGLPPKFYSEARRLLRRLADTQPEQALAVGRNLRDIITNRTSKLLSYASKNIPVDKIKNITEEEASLYLEVKNVLDKWLKLLGVIGEDNG